MRHTLERDDDFADFAAQALAVVAPDTRQIGAGSSVELIPLWR